IVRTGKVGAQPEGVTVAPDGRAIYVTSEEDNEVDIIDALTFKLLARPAVAARPRAVAFARDGKRAFVSAEQGAAVDVIDARTHRRSGRIRIEGPGAKPMGLAMAPDGSRLFVTTGRGGAVACIDARSGKVLRTEIGRAKSLDEALRRDPSFAVFRRSSSLVADPSSQGVNLRGIGPSGVSRALVLEDGVPLNDGFGGWMYWGSVPRLGIARVE